MSDPWLPEPPSAGPLLPTPPERVHVEPGSVADLLEATGGTRAWRLSCGHDAYVVDGVEGGPAFVREVGEPAARRLVEADAIARTVAAEGVRTACLLPGYPRPRGAGRRLVAYPYLGGRYAHADPYDGRRLGAELDRLHSALSLLPHQESMRDRAGERRDLMADRARLIVEGQGPFGPDPEAAVRHVRKWLDRMSNESDGAGPVHGDIHIANVLWLADENVAILDFEDALITMERPSYDAAAAVERFALVPAGEDRELARRIGCAIIEGYAKALFASGELAMQICVRSVRSLALLAEVEARGGSVPLGEWRKFLYLLDLADERSDVIADIENVGAL